MKKVAATRLPHVAGDASGKLMAAIKHALDQKIMRALVREFVGVETKDFCLRLWNELTIAGRCIWSDGKLDQATQLNALKWLNEIQHRVWNAYVSTNPDALMSMLDRIISHCEEAPALQFHVRVALDRSIAAVVKARAGSKLDGLAGQQPA